MNNVIKNSAYLLLLSAVLFLSGCSGEQFHVEGTITNAKDSVLYFEHNSLTGFNKMDSVKLDEKGNFAFSGKKADNPEFYRLRIADQIINIGIDSTETVNVTASYPQMAVNYNVEGSYENEKIKELALKQINLQAQCQAILAQRPEVADSLIEALIVGYKSDVSNNYIYKEPMKAYSYFALFQYIVVGNQARLIFDPTRDAKDNRVFGAVATSWDSFYPGSERGQNLHNITIKGMKDEKIVNAQKKEVEINAEETGVIDLPLRDNRGNERHLTDLKGQVVLLNFHAFSLKGSTQYIMQMRDLYAKYHAQGLEIYMVSLDDNEHFWKEQVANLPWINVYDNTGVSQAYTNAATATPIIYLIDRGNNVVKNPAQIKNLDAEIKALL
ncbi:TlpA disulfide reductase family protein [Prevotella corporis]|jgi:peroxiredoxin|uniref:TlpA disulfide reductase family protein n=1 Tax=Prevotella corporis TaxID=28128 RepID=UPI0023F34735|nr:TlpA disulfide reductase family protein [Prevotella corporis]MDQ7737828.1 AhpC/TSA family protein [Prevotella corporis]